MAWKHVWEQRILDSERKRRYIVVKGRLSETEALRREVSDNRGVPDEAKDGLLTTNGVEESVRVVKRHTRSVIPWRFTVEIRRAGFVTVTVGIGYLL